MTELPPSSTLGRARTVLILDEAVAFGGSIVSTANLIRGLDPQRYRAIFCTGAPRSIAVHRLQEAAERTIVVSSWKVVTYATNWRLQYFRKKIPTALGRRLAGAPLWAAHWLLNSPYLIQVLWLVLRHRIDLIQFNNGLNNLEGSLVAALTGRRMVAFFRGYGPMSGFVRRFTFPKVRGYVAVSEHIKAESVADGIPEHLVTVATPPAIAIEGSPEDRLRIRAAVGIPEDAPTVGFFGRIVAWKGQLEFLQAAALVARDVPNVRFIFVGDSSDGPPEYEEKVRAAVESLGLADAVVFTGYVDNVDDYYRAVDVVSHGSIMPEPSGRVIFEAMNHGLPVVASDLGGPKEFIDHGVDGFIVDPTDARSVAKTLHILLTNPVLRRELGERAKRKIQARHGPEQYAAKVMARYDQCFQDHD